MFTETKDEAEKKCQKFNQTDENDLTPQLFNYDGSFFTVEKSEHALESEF